MLEVSQVLKCKQLHARGASIRAIARDLDISRNTVRRYVRGERQPGEYRRSGPRSQPARDKIRSESLFLLFFAHLLDAGCRRRIYEGYLAAYRANLERELAYDVADAPPGQRFVHGLGLAVYRTIVAFMEANRHLLLGPGDRPEEADREGAP